MKRISKLALLSLIILFAVVYIWISNPLLALVLGSISLVPFMKNVFEIKKYHNRSLYLALSAVILVVGLISACIWIFSQDQILDKTIFLGGAGVFFWLLYKI